MKLAALLLLLAPFAAADEKRESKLFRALGTTTYFVSAGDAVSTELAFANGASELNPLQRNRGARIAAHVAVPVLVNWGTQELADDGHERIALWIRIAMVASYGTVTAINLRNAAR